MAHSAVARRVRIKKGSYRRRRFLLGTRLLELCLALGEMSVDLRRFIKSQTTITTTIATTKTVMYVRDKLLVGSVGVCESSGPVTGVCAAGNDPESKGASTCTIKEYLLI
jgi:hypothetical protein